MLAIGGAIFLLVNGVLLFSVIRFRAKKGDISDGPPIQGNTTLEFVWTVIPAIIVAAITIYSYQVWTANTAPQANEQVVNVVGQRFAWSFNYDITAETLPEGVTLDQLSQDIQDQLAGGKAITFSAPQLHTWAGQPVHAMLQTEDVNHAFWIPNMRIKQDLLAGRVTDIRFTPVEAGTSRIECAELCGPGHGDMAGKVETVNGEAVLVGAWLVVHADEQEYLNQFYYPEARKILFPPEDPAQLGQQILDGKGGIAIPCSGCHTLNSMGWTAKIGPDLDGIGSRAGNRIPGMSAADYIHDSLRNPQHFIVPGFTSVNMPTFQNTDPNAPNYMPDAALDAITAYLLTQ